MTKSEADKLIQTGKYQAGPIYCVWFDDKGKMHEDFSPGHFKGCNCEQWCKNLPEAEK